MKRTALTIIILAILVATCLMFVACHSCEFGEWAVIEQPNCTEAGLKVRVCSCGEKQTSSISATGHTWGDWYETKAPTLTEAGEERRDCETCDYYETNVLPALGQNDLINGTWGTWTK